MKTKLFCLATAALLSIGVVTAPAADAATATTSCLSAGKAAADAAINARLTVLAGHVSTVDAATAITAADRSALLSIYSNDTAGLTGLKAQLDAAPDCPTLRAQAPQIVTGYRIYVLVGPQTHLTLASDAGIAAAADFTAAEPGLRLVIAAAQSEGKDVTAAQAAYNDLLTQLPIATNNLNTAPLLALAPAGYPGNATTIQSTRAGVKTAAGALAKAGQDVKTILTLRPAA